jgi:hypothetical protein
MSKEKYFTEEIECTICKNRVHMEVLDDCIIRKEENYIENLPANFEETTNDLHWQIIRCPACYKTLLREGWWNEIFGDETGPKYAIIYPQNIQNKKINALPKDIEKAYNAAERVKLIDSNAFAVLLGRVLDKVLLEKNANGNTLNEKLNDLAQRNLIPKTIGEAAHGIRELRNIGAHADLGELTEEEIPILEDIINVILVYLYSAPDMIIQITKKVEEMKKEKK